MSKKQSDKATKKRVKATASSTAKKSTKSKETSVAPATKTAKALAPDPRLPTLGTTIEKRDRHGAVRCKCTVEEGGIRYAGKVYTSLSGAAMAAAKDLDLKNKTQNGYIFWGLIKPPRPASDPLVALERAWERYRDRVETLVKEGVTEENRGKVAAALGTFGPSTEENPVRHDDPELAGPVQYRHHVLDEREIPLHLRRDAETESAVGIVLGDFPAPILQREGGVRYDSVEDHQRPVLNELRVSDRVAFFYPGVR